MVKAPVSANVIIFASVLATLGAGGIYFLKRAGEALKDILEADGQLTTALRDLLSNSDMWIGTGLYGLAFLWMMTVISHVQLSQFYPLAVGLNIVLTCVIGVMLLGEAVTMTRLLGIVLILCGVVFAAR